MKVHKSNLFWGILLIGFGAYALAQSMGYEIPQEPMIWAYVFGGISLLSLIFYFVDGFRAWGWLFPFGIFGALGVTLMMVANDVDNAVVGSPIFFGLLIPFTAAYLIDRSKNWWALIPGGVMLFLALVTLLVDTTGNDEWIGSLFLFMIALSFFVVYMNNRARQWALLVAYIVFVLSLAPALASFNGDMAAYFGSVFLLAIALPFYVIYFRNNDNWWAIIPAGVMTVLAVIATLGIAGWIRDVESGGISNALLMGGLAATFAVVWVRHAKPWAKVVTIVLAALAAVSIFFASYNEMIWPLVIILLGAYLLYTALRPKSVQ